MSSEATSTAAADSVLYGAPPVSVACAAGISNSSSILLIGNSASLGTYSRAMPRALWWTCRRSIRLLGPRGFETPTSGGCRDHVCSIKLIARRQVDFWLKVRSPPCGTICKIRQHTPLQSEKGPTSKVWKTVVLEMAQAKPRIWPWLLYVCRIRSAADAESLYLFLMRLDAYLDATLCIFFPWRTVCKHVNTRIVMCCINVFCNGRSRFGTLRRMSGTEYRGTSLIKSRPPPLGPP